MSMEQPLYKTTFQTPYNVINNTELSQKLMKSSSADAPNLEAITTKLTQLDQNFTSLTNFKVRILNTLEKFTTKLDTVERTVSQVVDFLAYNTGQFQVKLENNAGNIPLNSQVKSEIKTETEEFPIQNDPNQNFNHQYKNSINNVKNNDINQGIQSYDNSNQTFQWLDEFQKKYPKQQTLQYHNVNENEVLNSAPPNNPNPYVLDQNQNEIKTIQIDNTFNQENGIIKEEQSSIYDSGLTQNAFIKQEEDLIDIKPDVRLIPSNNNSVKNAESGAKNALKIHSCNQCNYTASQAGNLRRHISIIHQKIKAFVCNDCNYSASMKHHLKKHFETVHHS